MTSQSDVSEFVLVRTFDDLKDYGLLSSFPFMLFITATYLLFVLKIGPLFMKNREPYKLKNTMLIYNAAQVLLSVLLVYLSLQSVITHGFFPKRCCEEDPITRKMMARGMYVYVIAKFTELLDTVFFVLRKKDNQVSFLHVYHHTTVIFGTWLMNRYSLNQTVVYTGFINAVVHIAMYFYYFMAALGPQYQKYLTWKKYMTTFQLVQFVTVILHQIISLAYTSCKHSIVGIAYIIFSSAIFYYLFSDFYKKSYNSQKTTKNGTQNRVEIKTKGQ